MSTKSTFRAAFERPASGKAVVRVRSGFSAVSLSLTTVGPIARPIDAMRLMNAHGVSLKTARGIVERLAIRQPVAVELRSVAATAEVIAAFAGLGISAVSSPA